MFQLENLIKITRFPNFVPIFSTFCFNLIRSFVKVC